MVTLEQELAKVKAKHEFNEFAKSISQDVEHHAICGKDPFITFKCKDSLEATKLLESLKPTNDVSNIGTATDRFHQVMEYPYLLKIINPASPSRNFGYDLQIVFSIESCNIWINIPLNKVNYKFSIGHRGVVDSEHVFFTGISARRISEMRLRCYSFNSKSVVNFYGGYRSLFCKFESEEIIKRIMSTSKSIYAKQVLQLMDSEEYSNNYRKALDYVLELHPDIDIDVLETELNTYI